MTAGCNAARICEKVCAAVQKKKSNDLQGGEKMEA